jgi:hypothetical protein
MSNNVHILQLSSYEAPIIEENKKNEWVTYGENNSYYSFLMDRYKKSSTNNAIINNISRLVYGKGLGATDASKKPNDYAAMISIFNADDLRRVVLDFEMLGQAAFQVHYSSDRKKVVKAYHIPVHLLAPEKCNKDGQIEAYYYSDNWEDVKNYTPKRIPSFGFSKEQVEIVFIQPYSVGMKYFSYVDYQGAIPYAVLEEEVAEYLINEVQNGFSGTKVVNFNNGVPTPEEQDTISRKVLSKLTGSRGQKVIVAFNSNQESKTTVDDLPLNDAPEHYSYLSEECMRKIMLGHNVTSPLLFGIANASGFSSNADELQNSFILFDNLVVRPKQEVLLSAIDKILAFNGITLNVFFKTLKPLEFTDLENAQTQEQVQEQTGVELKKDVSDLELDAYFNALEGESVDDEWEIVAVREWSEENDSIEEWANRLIKPKKNIVEKLASVIKSQPSRESNLDKSIYKVRYQYAERYSKPNSRTFCKQMMSRTANGVVYRLEDIDKASRAGVNKELGHKGQAYDLFKFKGGVNCSHYWEEVLYRLKKKTDGTYVEDKALSSSQEVSSIPKSYKPRPTGNAQSKIAPIDMPNNGHHPNYGK